MFDWEKDPIYRNRHPLINVKGLVGEIEKLLDGKFTCSSYKLGQTREVSKALHIIPLKISDES